MALQKGDFILIEYTAKVKETSEVFDTTVEETSRKEHLHKEGEMYEPKLVVIGEGWVLKASCFCYLLFVICFTSLQFTHNLLYDLT